MAEGRGPLEKSLIPGLGEGWQKVCVCTRPPSVLFLLSCPLDKSVCVQEGKLGRESRNRLWSGPEACQAGPARAHHRGAARNTGSIPSPTSRSSQHQSHFSEPQGRTGSCLQDKDGPHQLPRRLPQLGPGLLLHLPERILLWAPLAQPESTVPLSSPADKGQSPG